MSVQNPQLIHRPVHRLICTGFVDLRDDRLCPRAVPALRLADIKKRRVMADESEDIDFEQIVWDPRYRRRVIERLNRSSSEAAKTAATPPENPEPEPALRR